MIQEKEEVLKKLLDILSYDQETGVFRWKEARRGHFAGGIAGTINTAGYVMINTLGRVRRAHRLAWFFVYGELPTSELDHRNGIRSDNRIFNLRQATATQNKVNSRGRSDSRSGKKGVRQHGARWVAEISVNYKTVYLGTFDTADEAHAAYIKRAECLHGEFARAA